MSQKFQPVRSQPTAMADAFLKALVRWVARHGGAKSGSRRIVIPTGTVDADELVRVVRAISSINRRAS